jgi:hypothetical protein
MDGAIDEVQTRDMKKCCQHALCRVLRSSSLSTKLRDVVIAQLESHGMLFFERMFCRYAPYKMLTPPLRAKDLYAKASELGLLQRTNCIRVDTGTIRTECELAPTRKKMHMKEDINRVCRAEHTLKKKKKQCVQDILDHAMLTGVADITCVCSNFSVSNKHRAQ